MDHMYLEAIDTANAFSSWCHESKRIRSTRDPSCFLEHFFSCFCTVCGALSVCEKVGCSHCSCTESLVGSIGADYFLISPFYGWN